MLNINTYKPLQFSDLIERIWLIENTEKEVDLVVPPNQYESLVFPLNKSKYKRNSIWIDEPQIEGISLQNSYITYPAGTVLIGVRFYAYGLYPFIQVIGKELLNNTNNCSNVDEIDTYIESPYSKAIDFIYNFLSTTFCKKSYNEILPIMNFYNQFRWNDETLTIEEYCKESNTNYTTLNRNFSKIIGISPKKFERLVKFRKSLCSLIDSKNKLTSISADSGYFDQAHFIREFKIFLNQTPSDYKALIKQADKESQIINYNFKLF